MNTHCRTYYLFLIAILTTSLLISNAPAEVTPNAPVEPKPDIGLKGIGGQFGFVSPQIYGSTTLFGVILDLGSIPIQTSTLRLEGTGSYWSAGLSSKDFFGAQSETGINTLELNVTAKYYLPTGGGSLSPFVGGGLSFIRVSTFAKGEVFLLGEFDVGGPTGTDFGVHGVGGFDVPVGNSMTFRGEARFQLSGFDSVQVVGGLVFPFGRSEPQPPQTPAVSQGNTEAVEPTGEEAP